MVDFDFNGENLCMGSMNMDLVMVMDSLPEPGETVLTDNFSTYPGGKGGNQAVAAAMNGAKVQMFTKLGGDRFSVELVNLMSEKGVDTSRILRDPERTAGIAMIRVDKKGQNSISFTPGSNALLSPADVERNSDLFQSGRILLLTMEIAEETIYRAIEIAHEKGMFTIVDPAPAPRQGFPDSIASWVHLIKPNETEARILTGIEVRDKESARDALEKLRLLGFRLPIVTLGEKGIVGLDEDCFIELDPFKVNCVDTTAAGDVFSGALAAALSKGESLRQSLAWANAAGALSTTISGAQTSIPSSESVRDLLGKRV